MKIKRPSKTFIRNVFEAGESVGVFYVIEYGPDGETRFIPTDKPAVLQSFANDDENNPWDI